MAADLATGASDEELMRRLQGGEEAALAALMERWELPVKRLIFRLLGNVTEAEDLAQEVFCRIFTKRTHYRPGAKFSTWCYAIAANLAKNRLRWWQRHPVHSIDAWIEAGGEIAEHRGRRCRSTCAPRSFFSNMRSKLPPRLPRPWTAPRKQWRIDFIVRGSCSSGLYFRRPEQFEEIITLLSAEARERFLPEFLSAYFAVREFSAFHG